MLSTVFSYHEFLHRALYWWGWGGYWFYWHILIINQTKYTHKKITRWFVRKSKNELAKWGNFSDVVNVYVYIYFLIILLVISCIERETEREREERSINEWCFYSGCLKAVLCVVVLSRLFKCHYTLHSHFTSGQSTFF